MHNLFSRRDFFKLAGTAAVLTVTPKIVLSANEINPRDQAFLMVEDIHKFVILNPNFKDNELFEIKVDTLLDYLINTFPVRYHDIRGDRRAELNQEVKLLLKDVDSYIKTYSIHQCTSPAFSILVISYLIKQGPEIIIPTKKSKSWEKYAYMYGDLILNT